MRNFLLIPLFFTLLNAFEVNTHQAMMRCAITDECETEGSKNLETFIDNALLRGVDYSNEEFEQYDDTYLHYATIGEGLTNWNIDFLGTDYLAMLEAGSILEDSVYPDRAIKGDGRYNNHFYAVQFDSRANCTILLRPFMKTSHTLCGGYGQRTDNIAWALDDTTLLGNERKNDYTLEDAFGYFRASFEGTPENRRSSQAKLLVNLGILSHLVQDLHSPAHVRDDSHPTGDELEVYGQLDGGFNLQFGLMNENNNPAITQAVKNYDMKKWMLHENSYSSYQDIFYHEASWVSNNFFSKDRIFDGDNIHLKVEETSKEEITSKSDWFYIKTNANVAEEKGNIIQKKVALVEGKDNYEMVAVVDGVENTKALEDTSLNVMPRAIASTQTLLNYFFRATMKVQLEGEKLTITNNSDKTLVSSKELLTFKKGAKISLLYIDEKNVSKEFFTTTLSHDVAVDENYTIEGIKYNDLEFSLENKIIVLLDGQIGEDEGLDDYNIHSRGLSVAYARAKITHADILLSLDRSGSMKNSLAQVTQSIANIIDENINPLSNAYLAISTFSSRAEIISEYTNNTQSSKKALESIQAAGGTALYDALVLSAKKAKEQQLTSSRESIMIFYSDGIEQGSKSSKEEAINAISKATASEIDKVYLIYSGESESAAKELENIAELSGREFLRIDEVSKLQKELQKILLQ